MSQQPRLRVDNLSVRYQTRVGEVHAVNQVSFDVNANEVFGIAGESGCGKSTLIRSLLRLLPENGITDADVIDYEGQSIKKMSEKNFREQVLWSKISLVPQSAMNSLNPVYRVGDQIIEAIRAHSFRKRNETRERVEELFDVVGLEGDLMDSYPHEFSGGMRQRAMIAMSLALDPGLIIMDEPTTGLDPQARRNFWDMVEKIKLRNTTLILTTHYMEEADFLCDEIAIMDKGKIIAHGEPKQLIAQHFKEVVLELPENEVANHEFTLPFEYQFKYGYLEIYTKDIATTLNLLKEQNISVDKLKIRQFNLEDLFLKLTGSELRS